jgi:tRNA1Val (adenine37-N6)-methyltransferase
LSNPPYTKKGTGRTSPVRQRAIARGEVTGTLADLLRVSTHLAGPAGRIFFMYPVKRLKEVREGLKEAGLRARRVHYVRSGPENTVKLFLVEAGRA